MVKSCAYVLWSKRKKRPKYPRQSRQINPPQLHCQCTLKSKHQIISKKYLNLFTPIHLSSKTYFRFHLKMSTYLSLLVQKINSDDLKTSIENLFDFKFYNLQNIKRSKDRIYYQYKISSNIE